MRMNGDQASTRKCLEILLQFIIDVEDPDSILLFDIIHMKLADLLKSAPAV